MRAVDRRESIERAATDVFAERGYRGASIDEIARRSGVTPPVVYDHFASKRDLYERLLERHYAALRDIWFTFAATGDDIAAWIAPAVDAWFGYVEANRSAAKMLFREPTADPQIADVHDDVVDASRSEMMRLVRQEAATAGVDDDTTWMDLTWEVLRAVLQGLALWWYDHPSVPRERIVQAAMNGMWLGFERVLDGERWQH
jgi:AcrR family transcriptional regulator